MPVYDIATKVQESKSAVAFVKKYLFNLPDTIEITDVQSDRECREKNIDVIRYYQRDGKYMSDMIMVKCDFYYNTGNIFAETIANNVSGQMGCFLTSECDFIYYLYMPEHVLYVLPMKEVREWFLKNINCFKTSYTYTSDNNGNLLYKTIGKLVPCVKLKKEVPNIKNIRFIDNN